VPVRVLIVDDQASFRSAARAVVKAVAGFEVVAEAESGEDSIQEAARVRPDLVLMDVNLPGIDGLQATRRLLIDGGGPVVLLLSTRDADEYSALARECGAAAYITKGDLSPELLRSTWAAAKAAAR
jgi:two-component system, NarL family, invasion response regulator UvrY